MVQVVVSFVRVLGPVEIIQHTSCDIQQNKPLCYLECSGDKAWTPKDKVLYNNNCTLTQML